MSADPPFQALAEMMGHCFHQDMDLEAETVPEAVALYARGLTDVAGHALRTNIHSFRQQHADDLDGAFLKAFGDDLDPRDAGLSVDDFLRMVDVLVDETARRSRDAHQRGVTAINAGWRRNREGSEAIRKRVFAGLLLAPLWAPVVMTILAIVSPPPAFLDIVDRGAWIGMGAILGGVLGYVWVLAVGLPIHKLLLRHGHRSAWAYLATWCAGALLTWLLASFASFARDGLMFSLSYLTETIVNRPYVPISVGAVGSVVGVTFWAIVRPDHANVVR